MSRDDEGGEYIIKNVRDVKVKKDSPSVGEH
jgi:hypothetical protein